MRAIKKSSVFVFAFIFLATGLCNAQPKIPKENIPADISPEVKNQIELLYSAEPEVRGKAAVKLGEMGTGAAPAVPFLMGILDDKYPILLRSGGGGVLGATSLDREAAMALWKIGKPAVEPLIDVLTNKDKTVRKNAAEALGRIKDNRAVEPLINVLQDADMSVRHDAVEALGEIKDPRSIEPLCSLLKDKKLKIQQAAHEALQKIMYGMKDARAIEPLMDAFKNKE